ncbi:hypothetical protein FA13DRAFT_519216 [Coprinellus micaceus]|uniref:Uncharacterized protein n=1 Tax=Coprinellus micaceus TaxID=71717 RepID=A0A4Y7TAC2_COPMI|nr:hypothetical protein FA13DRAFT_519216 [Coprinellus micaceus]
MFIMAHLQMNVLRSCTSVYSLYEALEDLPSGVDDMYNLTLEHIEGQSVGDISIAHWVITWLLHSREPPSIALICHVLSFSMEQLAINRTDLAPVGLILSSCQGLICLERTYSDDSCRPAKKHGNADWRSVTISSDDPLDLKLVEDNPSDYQLRFIHTFLRQFHICIAHSLTTVLTLDYTVQEYIKTSVNLRFIQDPHSLISVTCVAFLAAYDREFQASNCFFTCRYFRLQPLLGYSLRHWVGHARICQDAGVLHPCIHTYFSAYPKLLHSDASDKDARSNSVALDRSYSDIRRLPSLHIAVLHKLTEVIDARILPFEVDDDGDEGYTPFHFATLYRKPNSLQALIASYDGVNVRSIPRGDTVLHITVQKLTAHEARGRTLQILASSPAVDPNIPNSTTGVTSLMLATPAPSYKDYDAELALSNDDTKLTLRILCSRVDLNLEVKYLQGHTAFWHACSMQGTASAFLSHYPDVDANVPDHDGVTPFMMAC